jgi:hypothetical protein
MEVMRVREDDRLLNVRVEIDDAYLGGERSGGKAERSIAPAATAISGGLRCFGAVQTVGATHERVVTGRGGGKLPRALPQRATGGPASSR